MNKRLNVLMVSAFYPAGPIKYLSEAFERMGLGVFRAGPEYNDHGGIDWGDFAVKTDLPFYREAEIWDIDKIMSAAAHVGFVPDFVFISEENYQTNIIPTTKVPTVFWSMDGWPNNFKRGEALNPTLLLTNHPNGIRAHPREEDPRWKFMPGAAAPWIHRNLAMPRNLDFSIMATQYGYRTELCQHFESRSYGVRYGFVRTEEYIEILNRSKFTYCNVNGNGGEAKWRGFEAMAMGCVNMIDEGINLFNRLGYLPDVHYVPVPIVERENGEFWPTGQILKEAWDSNWINGRYIYIADTAREKCLSQDTYYDRAKTVLTDLGFGHLGHLANEAKERDLT